MLCSSLLLFSAVNQHRPSSTVQHVAVLCFLKRLISIPLFQIWRIAGSLSSSLFSLHTGFWFCHTTTLLLANWTSLSQLLVFIRPLLSLLASSMKSRRAVGTGTNVMRSIDTVRDLPYWCIAFVLVQTLTILNGSIFENWYYSMNQSLFILLLRFSFVGHQWTCTFRCERLWCIESLLFNVTLEVSWCLPH